MLLKTVVGSTDTINSHWLIRMLSLESYRMTESGKATRRQSQKIVDDAELRFCDKRLGKTPFFEI